MRIRFFLSLLLVALFQPVDAKKYYFSSSSGDDKRTSVDARNPQTPWKSLDQLNKIFRSLLPGDSVLFKRGEVFYGNLNLSASGTQQKPIVISAYGTGPMPVITSLVKLEDWKEVENGIYEATHDLLSESLNVVLLDGMVQEMGRYPNSNAANRGYLIFEETNGENSITSSQLPSAFDWSGAEVVIRKSRWTIDRHRVKSHIGNTIAFLPLDGTYKPVKNHGFFIQNHINTLDDRGEWYYDTNNRKVFLYFGENGPDNFQVRVSTKVDLVSNDRPVAFITINGLHFEGANNNAFLINNGDRIKIDMCQIAFSGKDGVNVSNTPFFELTDTNVSYSLNNGINLGANTTHARIYENLVECTNIFAGLGQSGNGNGVAIQTNSGHNLIEYNKVINTGYLGIRFSGDSTIVKNNLVDGFCLTKDDGAGIYTWTGSSKKENNGRKIVGNIILNGIGVNEGTPSAQVHNPSAEGIYLDDYASGIEIIGNTVANVSNRGIFVHNARDLVIKKNTLYNNEHQLFILQDAPDSSTRNNVIEENLLISPHSGQTNITLQSNKDDIPLLATFERNQHVKFSQPVNISVNKVIGSNLQVSQFYDLEGWQIQYPNSDKGYDPGIINGFEVNDLISSNLFKNGAFDADVKGTHCFSSSEECVGEWSAVGPIDNGSLRVTTKGSSFLLMGVGSIRQEKNYILRFSAVTDKPISLKIFLRQSGAPYHPISKPKVVLIAKEKKEYEVLFSFPVSEGSSSIVFESGAEQQTSYWLDNISLNEAEISQQKLEDQILFNYNHSTEKKEYVLKDVYHDFENRTYRKSATLSRFSSLVLWKTRQK